LDKIIRTYDGKNIEAENKVVNFVPYINNKPSKWASEILRLSCKSLKIFTKKNIQVRNDEEDWFIDVVLKQPSLVIEALKN
jgi:hypothetical protein